MCNENGEVFDFCPPRKDKIFVLDYFEKNRNILIWKNLQEIKRIIGQSNSSGLFDFGEGYDIWIITKRLKIDVRSFGERCTKIEFIQSE